MVYKLRPGHDPKRKLRILHRNMYTVMIYWTIIIGKSNKTANLPTLNYNKDHLDKFTKARRKYLLNDNFIAKQIY